MYVGYLLWTHFDVPMHEAIAAFCRPAKCPLFMFLASRFSVSRRQHEDKSDISQSEIGVSVYNLSSLWVKCVIVLCEILDSVKFGWSPPVQPHG